MRTIPAILLVLVLLTYSSTQTYTVYMPIAAFPSLEPTLVEPTTEVTPSTEITAEVTLEPTNTIEVTETPAGENTETAETEVATEAMEESNTRTPTNTRTRTLTPSITNTRTPSQIIPTPTRGNGPFIEVTPQDNIQDVLNNAPSGSIIRLGDGVYNQDIVTVRDSVAIIGTRNAIIKGDNNARIIEINHRSVILDGFTIDGQRGNVYADKLIYVQNNIANTPLGGLVIRNMKITNAGGECVRLRYYIQGAIIEGNEITNCGRDDFPNGVWAGGGKNGEGIYIGTAPEQTSDGKNPTSGPDVSTRNIIQNNIFDTQGNECVDIKEGSELNVVRYNSCTGQKDENSGGMDSRGNNNIFEHNTIFGNLGAGIRLCR